MNTLKSNGQQPDESVADVKLKVQSAKLKGSAMGRVPGFRTGRKVAWTRAFPLRFALCALSFFLLLAGCTPAGPRALLDGEALLKQGRPAEAVERLRRATELLPGNAQAWNHLGLAYHRAGRVAEARTAYLRAQQLDPKLAAPHHNLGSLLLENGDAANAIFSFSSLVGLNPRSGDSWLLLGTAQLRARQPDRAEQSFRRVLELAPGHPVALNNLGWIQAQRRRPREAAPQFRTAVEGQPAFAPAWLNLAVVSAQLNQRPEALAAARRFAVLRPNTAEAAALQALAREIERQAATNVAAAASNTPVFNLPGGRAAIVTNTSPPPSARSNPAPAVAGRPAAATNVTVAAARPSAPTNPPAQPVANSVPPVAREVVELRDEPIAAPPRDVTPSAPAPAATNTVIVRAPATPPPSARPSPEMIRADAPADEADKPGFFQRLNPTRWDTAKLNPARWFGDSDKAAATNAAPASQPAVTPLAPAPPAQVARVTPPPAAAETARYTYQSPARPAPGDRVAAQVVFTEAVAQQRAGRPAEALDRYREAARLDPAFFDVHYNAAIAGLTLGNLPVALSASELALAVRPDSAEARYNFALALERSGHPVDAAVELEKLVQQQPDSVNGHLLLGNLYADPLRRPADARDHYRRVLELNPNHPQGAAIRRWLDANP